VATPATAGAQQTGRRPPTWCEHPAKATTWKRQDIVLAMVQSEHDHDYTGRPGRGADAPRLSDAAVGLLLQTLVPRLRAQAGFPAEQRARLPQGDERYTPAVLRTALDFTLRGDGTLEGSLIADHSDSTLSSDIITALRESGSAGELLIDGDTASRYDFDIWVATSRTGRAWWRAFSMYAPAHKAAEVMRDYPRITYPSQLLGWESTFVLQYVVGHDGRARRETMKPVPAIDSYAWPTAEERSVFEEFVERVKHTVGQWEYTPAQVGGCRVEQLVQQSFNFHR
jgi:hypothetical protein